MNISPAAPHTASNRHRSGQPSKPQAASEPKESFARSFLDDYGVELGTGAFMTAYSAVPVLGGMSSFGGASHILSGYERKTAFEVVSSLALFGAAASNIVGTGALCVGQTQLGLSLLAGSGVVGGVSAALLMDGGSLASRIGLQP